MKDATSFITKVGSTTGTSREKLIIEAILKDKNYPSFLSRDKYLPLEILEGQTIITLFVCPDYVSVGDNNNFLRTPMYPTTAQTIANHFGCLLPTKRIVDKIYAAGTIVVEPVTYAPKKSDPHTPGRTATAAYIITNNAINLSIKGLRPAGYDLEKELVVGHKKDIVLTNQLLTKPSNVAIYGWHQKSKRGVPIQGLNAVDHSNSYVDYSHGVRMISRECLVNGAPTPLEEAYKHPLYGPMLTGDKPLLYTQYPTLQLQ